MKKHRRNGRNISILMVHLVWVTKYRYPVLQGDVQIRCRKLLMKICDSDDVQILKGVVSKDHIHMHIEYPAKLSISDFVKILKGRISRAKEALVGKAFLDNRLWSMVNGKYY